MESPGSGDFVFYQTLYKEKPESNMALVWCVEHGVFSHEQAAALQKKYLVAKKELLELNRRGLGGGAASASSSRSSSSSSSGHSKRKKKRKVHIAGDGAVDAGLSVTSYEGIGSMGGM
jgi:hypothetical protein